MLAGWRLILQAKLNEMISCGVWKNISLLNDL